MLISDSYRIEQQKLHQIPQYGVASLYFSPLIADVYKKGGCKSISDYGAGKKRLLEGLAIAGVIPENYFPYDPAFPEYGPPKPADLVVCCDVLEHVETEFIENVLQDLSRLTLKLGLLTVHSGPAEKTLSDGRNAHLNQKPASWWFPKICQYFEPLQMEQHEIMGSGFWLIVKSKSSSLT